MTVNYTVRDGIAHIVLDNGKMNVLTPIMHKTRLLEVAETVTERDGVRPDLVVLRGQLRGDLTQNSRKRFASA